MSGLDQTLSDIRSAQISVLEASIRDSEMSGSISRAIQHLEDIKIFANALSNQSVHEMFGLATKELEQSFFSALSTHYRSALAGQRLSIELWFSGIQFSVNDVYYRKWTLGSRDINWRTLVDDNDGIFSKDFVKLYWEPGIERAQRLKTIACDLYRENSEYVHGNRHTHDTLAHTLKYSSEMLSTWCENLNTIVILFVYSALIRFNHLEAMKAPAIVSIITDKANHYKEIRDWIQEI